MKSDEFKELVWQKGRDLYRDMPWRTDYSPYFVLVSELMLQQTQVDRVIPKFQAFIQAFPTTSELAKAPLAEVLGLWSGLGYNRRAKYLHQAAKIIISQFDGVFPESLTELMTLPGVGPNTAGAIMAYGFNQPVVFIETNIRTVYFYHFFHNEQSVTDAQLRGIVRQTLDSEHPREWYWALMDYGSFLKKQGMGLLDKSKHYKKQSPLRGSLREVRGMILKELVKGKLARDELAALVPQDERFEKALQGLIADGLVISRTGVVYLSKD